MVYYQWENWRGARELKAAHQLLVDHFGTDDLAGSLSSPVPDEQNYLANPLIESWRDKDIPGHPKYRFPWQKLMPPDFKLVGDFEADLQSWKAMRAHKGIPLSEKKSLTEHFRDEAPQADTLILQLRDGLDRPHAIYRPGITERLRQIRSNMSSWCFMPDNSILDFIAVLGYQHRCVVQSGDKERAVTIILIMLRLVEAAGAENENLLCYTVSLLGNGLVHSAIEDTLGSSIWNEDSLQRVSRQLACRNDPQQFREVLRLETLRVFAVMSLALQKRDRDFSLADWFHSSVGDRAAAKRSFYAFMVDHGPRGWQEAGLARSIRSMVETSPSLFNGSTHPMERDEGFPWHAPGSQFAVTRHMASSVSHLSSSAAITHAYNRCVQVAMALEYHRIRRGGLPGSLAELSGEWPATDRADPFREGYELVYVRENSGYRILSTGPDRLPGNEDDIEVKIEAGPPTSNGMHSKAP
jgi:hypothetical protein